MMIDSAGNVLGGNGRMMMLQRVFKAGKGAAKQYNAVLRERLFTLGSTRSNSRECASPF